VCHYVYRDCYSWGDVIETIIIADECSVRVAISMASVRKGTIMSFVFNIAGGDVIDTIIINDESSARVVISITSVRRSGIMSIVIIIDGVM
jgi:hypothetical protein